MHKLWQEFVKDKLKGIDDVKRRCVLVLDSARDCLAKGVTVKQIRTAHAKYVGKYAMTRAFVKYRIGAPGVVAHIVGVWPTAQSFHIRLLCRQTRRGGWYEHPSVSCLRDQRTPGTYRRKKDKVLAERKNNTKLINQGCSHMIHLRA